jgi:SAM-dependent methyltransferase
VATVSKLDGMSNVTDAYSLRADEYTDLFGSMNAVHGSDRQLIDSWSETVTGSILDAGCGPGHWTNYLVELGLDARGIDRVPTFIEHAQISYPNAQFRIGSIDAIDEPDHSLGGVLSWYSTIHHAPHLITATFQEFARVLRPGGGLVLGFFAGVAIEEFDHAVAPAYRWPTQELQLLLESSGFDIVETHTRTGHDDRPRPHGAIIARLRPTNAGEPEL